MEDATKIQYDGKAKKEDTEEMPVFYKNSVDTTGKMHVFKDMAYFYTPSRPGQEVVYSMKKASIS